MRKQLRMIGLILLLAALIALLCMLTDRRLRADRSVTVTPPDYPVTINGRLWDAETDLPLLTHDGVTYFPVSYADRLGLTALRTRDGALSITVNGQSAQTLLPDRAVTRAPKCSAVALDAPVSIAREPLDAIDADTPFLYCLGTEYMPLTEPICTALCLDYAWSETDGLTVTTTGRLRAPTDALPQFILHMGGTTDAGETGTNSIEAATHSYSEGYRWMEIKGNYGIHGTNKPESIGHYVSNGCIRMLEQDVEALFDLVEIGTPVEITYNRIVVEKDDKGTIVYYIYPDGYDRQPLTVEDVKGWLAGYGVEAFEPDASIEKKIKASDGQPTFIAKAYPLTVNGERVKGKAIVKDDITYLPAADIAQALKISLGWKPSEEILVSSLGEAVGIEKKDKLYCNADDVAALFKVDGGINKQGIYALKSTTQAIVPFVKDGSPVDPNASVEEQARQAELNAQQEAAQELEKAEAREAARKEAAAKKAAAGKTENVTKTERIVVSK